MEIVFGTITITKSGRCPFCESESFMELFDGEIRVGCSNNDCEVSPEIVRSVNNARELESVVNIINGCVATWNEGCSLA